MNNSPWIAQLKRTRPIEPLDQNLETDIVIVGGGIAGVSTAYFLITRTDKRVILLEAGKIAHGATGHNAGQITSYFEMSFAEMVERFGLQMAGNAQRIIEEDARVLFDEIFSHAKLTTPRSEFVGYDGLATLEQINQALEDIYLKNEIGLSTRPILISKEYFNEINPDEKYKKFYNVVSQKEILELLESKDDQYIAALPFLSGCTNSALFSEELAGYLLSQFKERFILKENSFVSKVVLEQDEVIIHAGLNVVTADSVVLCTNGFESIEIENNFGKNIDRFFHEEVEGKVGYMVAYKHQIDKGPFAGTYTHKESNAYEPYFYVTRRPFEDEKKIKHNLSCIGGPEFFLPDRATYDAEHEYPLEIKDKLETFRMQTYGEHFTEMDYYWHGLMGYTKSGVRLIGPEKRNPLLLYNLGCNGVGILTSVYGGYRISQIIKGEQVEPTIFDPK